METETKSPASGKVKRTVASLFAAALLAGGLTTVGALSPAPAQALGAVPKCSNASKLATYAYKSWMIRDGSKKQIAKKIGVKCTNTHVRAAEKSLKKKRSARLADAKKYDKKGQVSKARSARSYATAMKTGLSILTMAKKY